MCIIIYLLAYSYGRLNLTLVVGTAATTLQKEVQLIDLEGSTFSNV